MEITSALVLYAVIWFLVLFVILPQRIKSQHEVGEVAPGTPASAPDEPLMRRKFIWTSVIAAVLWLVVYLMVVNRLIPLEDIWALYGFQSDQAQ